MERVVTHSATGASCTIHQFGACVVSFKTQSGKECLFVSRDAKKDGSKAIRGGIPLVFPQFGQPDKSMPQHGFLRTNFWTVDESSAFDDAEGAGISFSLALKDVKNSRGGAWAENGEYNCECVYAIKICGEKMITTLKIRNTGEKAFGFQTLQHTYFLVEGGAAQDPEKCFVSGLKGYSVSDKVTNEEYICGDEPITIPDNVDRVYNPPEGNKTVEVLVGVGGDKKIKLSATGEVDGKVFPPSCVVWNPYKDKAAAMSDFGDDEYVDMICVHCQPGLLTGTTWNGGKACSLAQVFELALSYSVTLEVARPSPDSHDPVFPPHLDNV